MTPQEIEASMQDMTEVDLYNRIRESLLEAAENGGFTPTFKYEYSNENDDSERQTPIAFENGDLFVNFKGSEIFNTMTSGSKRQLILLLYRLENPEAFIEFWEIDPDLSEEDRIKRESLRENDMRTQKRGRDLLAEIHILPYKTNDNQAHIENKIREAAE